MFSVLLVLLVALGYTGSADSMLQTQNRIKAQPVDEKGKGKMPIIVHVRSNYPGNIADRYIKDLKRMYDTYRHLDVPPRDPAMLRHIKLVHIHGTMLGSDSIGWEVLSLAQSVANYQGIPIYITVHDYQWLYPLNPNPTMEFFQTNKPTNEDLKNTAELFARADKIIFPSSFIKSYYMQFKELSLVSVKSKAVLVPHMDSPLSHGRRIPDIKDSINVAFFGEFLLDYGAELYSFLISKYSTTPFKGSDGVSYNINFHLFGRIGSSMGGKEFNEEVISLPNFIYHPITVQNGLHNSIFKDNIHLVMFLSLCPPTYNYGFTNKAKFGVPVMYLNRGEYIDRLDATRFSNYFPVESTREIEKVFETALNYALKHNGKSYGLSDPVSGRAESESVQWYTANYPPTPGNN
jgi:hypothetical protein